MRRLIAMALAATAAVLLTPAAAHADPADDGNRAWSLRPGTADGKPDRRTHYTLQGTPGAAVEEKVLVTNRKALFNYDFDALNTSSPLIQVRLLCWPRVVAHLQAQQSLQQPSVSCCPA